MSKNEEIRKLKASLTIALSHAEEFYDGCLMCGEGEVIDGESVPHGCWYDTATALLKAPTQPPPVEGCGISHQDPDGLRFAMCCVGNLCPTCSEADNENDHVYMCSKCGIVLGIAASPKPRALCSACSEPNE